MSACSIPDIQRQNLILNAFVEKNDTEYTKMGYLLEQKRTILNINTYLFWIYISLVIIYAYVLFINENKLSIYMKCGLLSLFLLYPFIITKIETVIWQFMKFIYDTMVGNVYVSSDY